MNIMGLLKKKYDKHVDEDIQEPRRRRQYNMPFDKRLVKEVKRLSAEFSTPAFTVKDDIKH